MSGALELRDLVKHYAGGAGEVVRAVDGVSLKIDPGEFVALFGPSGSGKTTLLLLAAALLEPDTGGAWFGGRELAKLTRHDGELYRRRDLGFVFQSFHLIMGASAVDNAALKLIIEGVSLREARGLVLPWLERVGLAERAKHLPAQLSMGERQRVAIARALVNEPRLLLADEPTGNLDVSRSREILGLLRDICHERGIPGLLVTHDQQAMEFVDRSCTLEDGRMVTSQRRSHATSRA